MFCRLPSGSRSSEESSGPRPSLTNASISRSTPDIQKSKAWAEWKDYLWKKARQRVRAARTCSACRFGGSGTSVAGWLDNTCRPALKRWDRVTNTSAYGIEAKMTRIADLRRQVDSVWSLRTFLRFVEMVHDMARQSHRIVLRLACLDDSGNNIGHKAVERGSLLLCR